MSPPCSGKSFAQLSTRNSHLRTHLLLELPLPSDQGLVAAGRGDNMHLIHGMMASESEQLQALAHLHPMQGGQPLHHHHHLGGPGLQQQLVGVLGGAMGRRGPVHHAAAMMGPHGMPAGGPMMFQQQDPRGPMGHDVEDEMHGQQVLGGWYPAAAGNMLLPPHMTLAPAGSQGPQGGRQPRDDEIGV